MITNQQYLFALQELLKYISSQNLSEDQIYTMLASYGVEENTKGLDRTNIKQVCSMYPCQIISELKKSNPNLIYNVQDQGAFFRHINVTFDSNKNVGSRDTIKLYIPIKTDGLKRGTELIYNFLFQNEINFQSKISGTERTEMFVLRVHTKEDAEKVINFCSTTPEIYSNYTCTNPCMAHVNGIGVAKDSYNLSYNKYMAQSLAEYSKIDEYRNSQNPVASFIKFLRAKYNFNNKSQEKYMAQVAMENMITMLDDGNILDMYQDNYEYSFEPNFFFQYKRFRDSNGYFYKDKNENIINEQTNPSLFISLQAQNCLHKMYSEKFGQRPTQGYYLGNPDTYQLSRNLDRMLDCDRNGRITPVKIESIFKTPEVNMLLPYLYADFARVYKQTNEKENLEIVRTVAQNEIMIDQNIR